MADRLPTWQEGPVALEDFQDQTDYIRASTPKEGPGVKIQRTPGGSVISAEGGSGGELRRIQIPAGGIASGASADCFYYKADHTLSTGTDKITVWNRWSVSVGGVSARDGLAGKIRIESDEWHIVNEICP